MEDLLTKDDCMKILQERFKTAHVEYKSFEWAPLSENVEGFLGDHYILKITYRLDDIQGIENFFIKTKPNKTELQIEMAAKFNAYEKEIFLYDKLFREFEKRGYYTGFAPKAYYCKNIETLVMEDLKTKDFVLSGRRNFYDLDHCKAALKALAYYHANSISYEEARSKELGKEYRFHAENPNVFKEAFYIEGDTEGMGARYIKCTIECFKILSKSLPESEEWKKAFVDKLESFDGAAIFWTPLPYRTTCTHGDLWCNNMLFRYTDGVPTHCCLVDFQLLRQHHPSFDALLVIYSNTLRDFRRKNLQDLLQYYYATFEGILKDNGYPARDILPWEHFIHSANIFKSIACLQSASDRNLVLMSTDVINSAVNSGGGELVDLMFEDRPRIILKAFQTDEEYRMIVTDDIYDLYEHL